MTQETKLTEPVQVGLWYETKAGDIVKIYSDSINGNARFRYVGNNQRYYDYMGNLQFEYMDADTIIRCLGAAPFKSMCECNKNKDLQEKTTMITKEVSLSSPQPSGADPFKQAVASIPATEQNQTLTTPQTGGETPSVMVAQADRFERIFTAVLLKNMDRLSCFKPSAIVKRSLDYTQEAIKQLKEIGE